MSQHKCGWCQGDTLYEKYHDEEWGVPVHNDQTFFEFLILESFQAGLSWITILRKRENFRKAFDNFDYKKVAGYDSNKIQKLMQDQGIIRHELKIRAAITNAQALLKIQEDYGSFSNYIWKFVNDRPLQHSIEDYRKAPAIRPESEAMSKDLKRKGFKFMGPTVAYAFMQATGLVNDHEKSCFRYAEVKELTI